MKIYTKTGDRGETGLFGGKRVSKDSDRIEAYGSVDELNTVLGVVRAGNSHRRIDHILGRLQHHLFELGADLATPLSNKNSIIPRIKKSRITYLEKQIDSLEGSLTPLKSFILPGGSAVAAQLHLARTVCRRAERHIVRLSHHEELGGHVVVYVNRLSDLLFVLARYANFLDKKNEEPWESGKR